ncbi:MAG: hypothetical protein ACYDDS_17390 [Candidatus Sulfotelmatobacter sp.]
MTQVIVFDAGWLFFAAWGLVLAAVSVIAFGRDLLRFGQRKTGENNQQIDH